MPIILTTKAETNVSNQTPKIFYEIILRYKEMYNRFSDIPNI